MRNSIAILGGLLITSGCVFGSEDLQPAPGQFTRTYVSVPAVMMLPGMRPSGALPRPLISDVINIPNPFDSRKAGAEGQTQIAYRLDKDVPLTITVYDLLGSRVRRWQFTAGQNGGREGVNSFYWDGTDENGRKVAKGGYLAQLEIDLPGAAVSVIRKIGVIH